MTDIDFEELDKAVSSVINDNYGDNPEPKSAPEENKTANRPIPQLNNPRRRGGRFMDVVHPSSDMRSTNLKPVSEPKDEKIDVDTSKLTPEEDNKSSFNMPDPIDIHEQKILNENDKFDDNLDKPNKELEGSQKSDSPFIADAKVEKRPLGAFSVEAEPQEIVEPEVKQDKVLEQDQSVLKDDSLPAELQKDVLSIEGDSTTKTQATQQEQIVTPVLHIDNRQSSIAKEKTPTPVYDTKDYHAALMHAPKKKSGWLTVVWIVLVIALGALSGFSLYWFILK